MMVKLGVWSVRADQIESISPHAVDDNGEPWCKVTMLSGSFFIAALSVDQAHAIVSAELSEKQS